MDIISNMKPRKNILFTIVVMYKKLFGVLFVGIIGILFLWVVNAESVCWGDVNPSSTTPWIEYWCDGEIPIITIYGQNGNWDSVWITIKAINEWTWLVKIWTWESSYWSYYQWWNNFPFSWTVIWTTATTDASWFGPASLYYYSGKFIRTYAWDSSNNRNLWWGSWDYWSNNNWIYSWAYWWFNTWSFTVINPTDRKWMCDTWYHIPSAWEWNALLYLWMGKNLNSIAWVNSSQEIRKNLSNDFYLPLAGYLSTNLNYSDRKKYASYWSSSPYVSANSARSFDFDSSRLFYGRHDFRADAHSVRCFRDSYIKHPQIFNLTFLSGDVEVRSWVVISWSVYTWDVPGTGSEALIPNMRKDWYEFDGWFIEWESEPFNFTERNITGNLDLHAHWTAIEYTIIINVDGNEIILTWKYGDLITKPADPSKNGYKFVGWEPEFPTTMPLSGATIKAIWERLWSSGWGWRSNKTSDKQDSSTSSLNDKNTENVIQSETKWSEDSGNTSMDSSDKSWEWQQFTEESQEAYEFAKEKWITTMPSIQKAEMDKNLTRIAMAKMLSQYAMNILWQKPENIITPKFNDVTDKQNSDYDDWVTLSYQLWIMWQNMPNNKFRPNDEVTRAEFATALSRMVYHTSDGEYKSTPKYYIHHMEKLASEWIITNDNPKMKELRWYVMIMLMRSAK